MTAISARNHAVRYRRAFGYAGLIIMAVIFIFPFLFSVVNSFKTDAQATNDAISFIPNPVSLAAWKQIFGIGAASATTDFPRWGMNSVFVSFCITIGRVFLDSMAGYALARLRFPGRKLIFGLIIATLAVPSIVLMIPIFLVLKQLGMFNSYEGMILPMLVDVTGIFMMRQFFIQVPDALEEAGRVDGATIWQVYWKLILPVVRPGIIALTILSFQASWNQFMFYEIATISPKYFTLVTGLANVVGGGLSAGNQFPLKLGASVVTILPMVLLFVFLQRYFMRGATAGAVKG
jgi:multiple sugar transport system permease protein